MHCQLLRCRRRLPLAVRLCRCHWADRLYIRDGGIQGRQTAHVFHISRSRSRRHAVMRRQSPRARETSLECLQRHSSESVDGERSGAAWQATYSGVLLDSSKASTLAPAEKNRGAAPSTSKFRTASWIAGSGCSSEPESESESDILCGHSRLVASRHECQTAQRARDSK